MLDWIQNVSVFLHFCICVVTVTLQRRMSVVSLAFVVIQLGHWGYWAAQSSYGNEGCLFVLAETRFTATATASITLGVIVLTFSIYLIFSGANDHLPLQRILYG